ncbi:MAG: Uma2 family endonuclease [Rhizobiales bacterium]|nr:Uma2 family endonuclease [Hyphomicrobiales bacterium]
MNTFGETPKQAATYADIEAAPENVIAEILDGELVTQPRPSPRHSAAASVLGAVLTGPYQNALDGPGGWIFFFETEVKFVDDLLVPDIAGWRRERLPGYPEKNYFTIRPDWVCEILSGSTERRDRTVKTRIYANAGVPYLWLLDPRAQILETFELAGGRWAKSGAWSAGEIVRVPPFDVVSFSLADLWPLDRPLGFNEDPTPYYVGDR